VGVTVEVRVEMVVPALPAVLSKAHSFPIMYFLIYEIGDFRPGVHSVLSGIVEKQSVFAVSPNTAGFEGLEAGRLAGSLWCYWRFFGLEVAEVFEREDREEDASAEIRLAEYPYELVA